MVLATLGGGYFGGVRYSPDDLLDMGVVNASQSQEDAIDKTNLELTLRNHKQYLRCGRKVEKTPLVEAGLVESLVDLDGSSLGNPLANFFEVKVVAPGEYLN